MVSNRKSELEDTMQRLSGCGLYGASMTCGKRGQRDQVLDHDAHAGPCLVFSLGNRQLVGALGGIQDALTFSATFRTQMSVESVHTSKCLVAPLASEGTVIGMQLFVTFTIVLPSKALAAARPFALEWPFLVVGPHMTLQVEASCERTTTAWHRTQKVGVLLPATMTCTSCAFARHSLL